MGSVVAAPGLQSTGSVVEVYELSCSATSGVFLDLGSNPCLLHWQADSLPLSHQGSPGCDCLDHLLGTVVTSRGSWEPSPKVRVEGQP